jgi:multicomponent K+:H+ antiporter subunit D
MLLDALVRQAQLGLSIAPATAIWWFFGLLLVSGLVATVSMARSGIRHFWTPADRPPPHVKIAEAVPVLALLLACTWLTVRAESVLRYTSAAAESLHEPAAYIDAVLAAAPRPGPTRPVVDAEAAP